MWLVWKNWPLLLHRWVLLKVSEYLSTKHLRIQRVGQGVWTPLLKNHKNIGFLSNIGPDPIKITKLPSQHSILGHHGSPVKHHLNGVSLGGRLWPAYSGIWILPPLIS